MPWPPWERLSDARERVVKSAECSKEEAEAEIGQAIADRAVKIHAKLKQRSGGIGISSNTLDGGKFDIPTQILPTDLDWEMSRPTEPWLVPRGAGVAPGYWYLEWIELSRTDVTNSLCAAHEPGVSLQPASNKKAVVPKRRTRPSFERAKDAIDALYPQGVPRQAAVSNKTLCRLVVGKLKELSSEKISDETILRAAGRRK